VDTSVNDYKIDYDVFISRIEKMFGTLRILNVQAIRPDQVWYILQHIRENSQYVFNVKSLFNRMLKTKNSFGINETKRRNYNMTESMSFKTKMDFMKARNEAEKIVNNNNNYDELFCLLHDRILKKDYSYLSRALFKGHKRNNQLVYAIITKFNLLCTGLCRTPRHAVKSEPLYMTIIKGLLFKALSLPPQIQNAFSQNGIKMYERKLIEFNRLVNNGPIVDQLFLILCNLSGQQHKLIISENSKLQKQLKSELLAMIDKKEITDFESGAAEFDSRFKTKKVKEVTTISDLENIFETDMNNSIFNQISIEEADNKGEIFFREYLQFHGEDEIIEIVVPIKKPIEIYNFPEFDF
jgi:hypothetical protein